MRQSSLILLAFVVCAGVVMGGEKDPAKEAAYLKAAIEKQQSRAEDAMKHHANSERFEKKFGWAKEKHGEQFDAMMRANAEAADAWATVVEKSKSASHPDELSDLQMQASMAASEANLAERSLKMATAVSEREHMAEKTGSDVVKQLAEQLNANDKALLEAVRAKEKASNVAHKLELENRALNKALRDAYHQARMAEKEQHQKPRDKDVKRPKDE